MSFALRIILVILLFFLVEFYFYKKIKKSVNLTFPNLNKKKLRLFFIVFFTFVNLLPLLMVLYWLYIIISGSGRWAPVENIFFDYLVVYPFWFTALIIAQTIVFFIPVDLTKLILFPLYKKWKEKLKGWEAKFVILLVLFAIIYVPVRVIYDHNFVSVRITETEIENLPEELEGFKIAFISDTQADRYTDEARLSNFVNNVNSTEPDLVLVAGDIITSTPNYIEMGAGALGKINAKYGVYTCVGDHDNWAYREEPPRSIREITAALARNDVMMINNENKVIDLCFQNYKRRIGYTLPK